MSPDLDKKLCEKYPMLYNQRGMDMRSTCMCWGFDCNDGWYGIVDRLSSKLEAINQKLPPKDEEKWQFKVEATQVKEKYARLCFYLGATPSATADEVYKLVEEAEAESTRTCEECGEAGSCMVRNGWYKTLCKKCGEGYDEVPQDEKESV